MTRMKKTYVGWIIRKTATLLSVTIHVPNSENSFLSVQQIAPGI